MAAVHLLTCSFGGDLQGIKRLVDNGVEVNAQDYDNRSALHLAACEGHTHVVEYLLQVLRLHRMFLAFADAKGV
jgi:ankyrin repeat protein